MALIRPAFLLLSLAFAFAAAAAAASTALDASFPDAGWGLAGADPGEELGEEAVRETTCGSGPAAGECGGDGEDDEEDATVEAAADAEEGGANVSRRGLVEAYPAGRMKFISYAALAKDRVPCSRRGHSYYNCRRMKRANPYRRGCSMITHCARILR